MKALLGLLSYRFDQHSSLNLSRNRIQIWSFPIILLLHCYLCPQLQSLSSKATEGFAHRLKSKTGFYAKLQEEIFLAL